MNALRLPILNRPSRTSSPAPPTAQVTPAVATGAIPSMPQANGHGQTPAANGHNQGRSRSLSRNIADRVTGLQSSASMGPPATTPSISRPSTPRVSTPSLPNVTANGNVNGDMPGPQAGYMEALSLRLNESVNKNSAGVDFKAKKGFKRGAGWNVGEAVIKELPFPPKDAYLIRAVLRTAVRSISIYLTRLDSLLLPALTDPAFTHPLALSPQGSNPLNATQLYAVSVAHAAWETCEVFEQALETGQWPKFVQETLRPVMDKLDLVVGRVTQPLLQWLKRDLVISLTQTEGLSPPGGKTIGLASVPIPPMAGAGIPLARETSNLPHSRLGKEPSDKGHVRQLPVPSCLQHFAARVDGSRKVLEIIAGPCQDDGEAWVTGVAVTVAWKGICLVAEKDMYIPGQPPSPSAVSKALNNLSQYNKERDSSVGAATTAPPPVLSGVSGVTAKLTSSLSILPSRSGSRAPSPPRHASKYDFRTLALLSFESLMKRLVVDLVPSPSPPPANGIIPEDQVTERLAREALFEAQEAIRSFRVVAQVVAAPHAATKLMASLKRVIADIDPVDAADEALDDAIEDMPAVSLFATLLKIANSALSSHGAVVAPLRHPSEWMVEYDRTVLSAFGAAEEWERRVAQGLKGEVERVLGSLKEAEGEGGDGEWVRVLGMALNARAAVVVQGLGA